MKKYVIINRERFGIQSHYLNFLEKVYVYSSKVKWLRLRVEETMTRVNLFNDTQEASRLFESLVNLDYTACRNGSVSCKEDNYIPVEVKEIKTLEGRTFYRLTHDNYWFDKDDLLELTLRQVKDQFAKAIKNKAIANLKGDITIDMLAKLIEKSICKFMKCPLDYMKFDLLHELHNSMIACRPHFIQCRELKDHHRNPNKNQIELKVYCERPSMLIGRSGFNVDLWISYINSSLEAILAEYNAEFSITIVEYEVFISASEYINNDDYVESYVIL